MNRYTRKTMFGDYGLESTEPNASAKAINRLGEIEDILEDLNIEDTDTLKRVLKVGIIAILTNQIDGKIL